MKITNVSLSVWALALAAWLVPHVAWACPMCFSGNGVNQSAFLYGSLFLMFLPVTAIGSLVYWGYRRYRAWDEVELAPEPKAPHVAQPQPLRVVGRR
jgi:hypothetical protein